MSTTQASCVKPFTSSGPPCFEFLPERRPFTGNVAWARKLGSENMSSSLTTKRRKVSSGSYTVKRIGSAGAFHNGFRPLSPATAEQQHGSHDHKESLTSCLFLPSPYFRPLGLTFNLPISLPFLTIDDGLKLLFCMSTQLDFDEWTGNAAPGLRKVSGSNHLQRTTAVRIFSPGQWSVNMLLFIHVYTSL